jgi:hypothetical protein
VQDNLDAKLGPKKYETLRDETGSKRENLGKFQTGKIRALFRRGKKVMGSVEEKHPKLNGVVQSGKGRENGNVWRTDGETTRRERGGRWEEEEGESSRG